MGEQGFFDRYPLFYQSGDGSSGNSRLWVNARYDILIKQHADLIKDKTIVDLGSNDGRWSFAAIKSGAKHVVGIEWAKDLVTEADSNMDMLGVPTSSYEFIADNLIPALADLPKIDVAFVFGVLYMQFNHLGLFARLAQAGAETIIVDTSMSKLFDDGPNQPPVFEIWRPDGYSVPMVQGDHINVDACPLSARPNKAALSIMFSELGYDFKELDWAPHLSRWDDGSDDLLPYRSGKRRSFIARKI